MTDHGDPFAKHRAPLRAALHAAVDGVAYSYAALLQRQVATIGKNEDVLLPGLLCLATADTIGGQAEPALPAAASLVLLGAMSLVFEGIAAEGASELEREWGMPRALNAGDGLYALAQAGVLEATAGMTPERRLKAIELLDGACHELSLEMHAGSIGSPALLSAGVALGALFAGAELPVTEQLRSFGRDLSTAGLKSLPEGARAELAAVATYIQRRRPRR